MRVAIIGSRSVDEQFYPDLCNLVPIGASEIISGGAAGADCLAARYADEHHLPLTVYQPDYPRYGKSAPHERNAHIVGRADYVLAMWDGISRGTAHVIDLCIKTYKPVRVIRCHEGG